MQKEILYHNPKTNELTLKRSLSHYEVLFQALSGDQSAWDKAIEMAEQGREYDMVSKTIRLTGDDKFDLQLGYALLDLEFVAGSKRRRERVLQAKLGELLNQDYRTAVITLVLSYKHMGYGDYVKHVEDIYANDKKNK